MSAPAGHRTIPESSSDVVVVRLPDVGEELLRDWRALAAAAVEPNPFFEPELLLPAVRHLAGGQEVRLLTVRSAGELVLALPVVRTRYRRFPALTTWKHPYCYLGTPLVRADALQTAPAAALRALRRETPGLLAFEQVAVEGPVMTAFRHAAADTAATWTERDLWSRPVASSRDDAAAAEAISARSAKTLRRLRRNLERDIGTVAARDVAADPSAVEAEVDAFLEMELASWKGRAGTAMANDADHAAFFRATCAGFADTGRLSMWQLSAGEAPAAREAHLRAGDTVFTWKTAFDEDLGKFSPGMQLELDTLDAFHADPRAQWLDTCTADVPTNSGRVTDQRRLMGDVLVGLSPAGKALARAVPLVGAAWTRAKALLRRDRPADQG